MSRVMRRVEAEGISNTSKNRLLAFRSAGSLEEKGAFPSLSNTDC